ncbi:hypothetical protein ONE63_003447 [Megalurothrips usitatus]|uniref:NFX1-type zinc finger-containing protein 1-like n=1 Tax=Megalurothrips usitatus TaxID=439358 RepID=A0AAV7XBS1_9NEOP|nr:hypothetical protein ONE63_003447 [Megalurothrips usitatus]
MLVACEGDCPAQAKLGGFKESVSAERPCRQCLAPRDRYLSITDIAQFERRTKRKHEEHVTEVEQFNRRDSCGVQDPSVKYGVNYRRVEGLICMKVLAHAVTSGVVSLPSVNEQLQGLSQFLPHDRPNCLIKEDHLYKGLRQSAAQMRNLAILLPFVLVKDGKFTGEANFLSVLLSYLKLMNLMMAYELHERDAYRIKKKVEQLHQKILEIEPDLSMAKVHFLHHFWEQVLLFGPIRQHACYRFEGHFAFFKRMARIIRNYTNIIMSTTNRHQTRLCHYMLRKHFLFEEPKYSVKFQIPRGVSDPEIKLVRLKEVSALKIAKTGPLEIHGNTYQEDGLILLSDTSRPFPEFGRIINVFVVDDKRFILVCHKMKTRCLDEMLNAYRVQSLFNKKLDISVDELIFPHRILSILTKGKHYAIPIGHRKLLT